MGWGRVAKVEKFPVTRNVKTRVYFDSYEKGAEQEAGWQAIKGQARHSARKAATKRSC